VNGAQGSKQSKVFCGLLNRETKAQQRNVATNATCEQNEASFPPERALQHPEDPSATLDTSRPRQMMDATGL
jgi:hypothetical protein